MRTRAGRTGGHPSSPLAGSPSVVRTAPSAAPDPVDGTLSRRLAGRLASVIFAISGLVLLVSLALPTAPTTDRANVAVVGLGAITAGLAWWFLPWHRWPRSASLWAIPVAFFLCAISNHFQGTGRLHFGIFFVVAFTWIGIAHPRGTSIRFVPAYVVAYLLPLVTSGQYTPAAISSAIITGGICVMVSETLAWVSDQLRDAQADLDRRKSEARFRSLIQKSSDVITIVDPDTTIAYQSPSVERLLGYGPTALVGTRLIDVLHADNVPSALAFITSGTTPAATASAIWRLRHSDGSWREMEVIATNLLDDPTVGGIVLNARDVTERRALEEQLTHQAFHDPLTGLANRALFKDRLEHALQRAARHGGALAVLFIDLDDFKVVNDSLGHAAGDELLLATADRLRECVRATDTAARLGGDEFAILLEEIADANDSLVAAQRILGAVREPLTIQGKEVQIHASLGIATGTARRETADELLRNADVAMYMAKSAGKDGYRVFEPAMHAALVDRLELQADLQRAVDAGQLAVWYQPIVALDQSELVGVEALIRWHHPTRGLIAPAEFIPLAEETGLIVPIGRWVLERACTQARAWQDRHPEQPPLGISVNLSPKQLLDTGIVDDVARILRRTGLPPETLTLEVTENVLVQDSDATLERFRALKALGIRLALDDFGTGYSSLSYLHRFPIDVLKIDKSFISNDGTEAEGLMRAIIGLGQTLRMETVAEGIEQVEQLERLRALGCDQGQGYYFARPAPANVADALVAGPCPSNAVHSGILHSGAA